MARTLWIPAYGTPAPQGSKRAFAVRGKGGVRTGRVAVIEQNHDRIKTWRQAVIDAAETAHAALWIDVPITVQMIFWLARPRSHYGSGRNETRLRPSAPAVPGRPPDLSKLVRATEDALTDVGVWRDDGQIVNCLARKCWAEPTRPPGADIIICWGDADGHETRP